MNQINRSNANPFVWRVPIIPTARLLWSIFILSILCTVLNVLNVLPFNPWYLLLGLLILIGFDLFIGLRLATPTVQRQVADNWSLAVATTVRLHIHHMNRHIITGQIHDWHPEHTSAPHAKQQLVLKPNIDVQIEYQITAHQRGLMHFTGIEFHLHSPWCLWHLHRFVSSPNTIRVLPNFTRISHYRLLATANRLSDLGVFKQPRRGSGLEFHQLREYRQGDSLRQVHWQATAAQHRIISKEYEDERNQQVIFMIDTSRRMLHQDSHESLIDEALNSALLLAHVALNQGDAVGMLNFGKNIRWRSPRTGMPVVSQLMNQFYDIQAEPIAADYLSTAEYLLARQKKRSLVVMITNTRNEDFADLELALRLLSKKHIVVLADIREELLRTLVHQPISDIDDAVHFHAAHQYLENRWRQHRRLRHHGIRVLDVEAKQLPPALVSQYLQLKESAEI